MARTNDQERNNADNRTGFKAARKDGGEIKRDFKELRERAENALKDDIQHKLKVTKNEAKGLAQELDVYRTELEMQNDELRIAQTLLEESRDKYFELYDFAPIAYITINKKGLISEVNLAGAKLLGLDRERLTGKGLANFIEEDYLKIFYDHLKKVTETGKKNICELKLKSLDKRIAYVLLESLAQDYCEDGDCQIRVAIIDITDRKVAEEEKNNFISVMSHELRNPLTPILSGAQLIRTMTAENHPGTHKPDKAFDDSVKIIEQQAKNMARLLDDLLDISRITRGQIILKKQSVNLLDSIGHAIRAVNPLVKKQHHKLSVSLPDSPIYLEADPVRLEQIIINLLNNAVKYTPAGGQIGLDVRRAGQNAEIIIRDNGIGIDPSRLDSVFNLFTRVDTPFVSTQGELGIGLKLSKDLIAMHGGTITAVSKGKDKGSEFKVLLPILPENLKLNLEIIEPIARDRAKSRILIVDDNESITKILAKVIKSLGHDVRVANDGASALAMAKEYRPHIIFMDIGMPGMSGYEAVREMRQLERISGYKMKIVAVTGYGQQEDKDRTKTAGFDFHLTKPMTIETIKKTIDSI